MSTPAEIIPRLEGIVGSITGGKQNVAEWVKMCKILMLSTGNREKTDWEFTIVLDIDETAAATATAPESGATLYAMLVGTNSADVELDWLLVSDDADGTLTTDGTAALVNDVKIVHYLPAAAVDGTEDLHPYIYPEGVSFTSYVTFTADGQDGTNPADNDIRAWILYRTAAS